MTNQTRKKTNGCISRSVRAIALTADDLLARSRDLLPECHSPTNILQKLRCTQTKSVVVYRQPVVCGGLRQLGKCERDGAKADRTSRSNNPTAIIREKRRLRTNLAKLSLKLGNFRIARSSLFNCNLAAAQEERYFKIEMSNRDK